MNIYLLAAGIVIITCVPLLIVMAAAGVLGKQIDQIDEERNRE